METDKITESTSTYVILQSTRFGINVMGTVNLTTSQYLLYNKRMERLNRIIDDKVPNIRIGLTSARELTTQTLDSILQASEDVNRMTVYSTKMEYPNLEEKAKEELEKANNPYEMEMREIEQLTDLKMEKCYVVYVHGSTIDPHIFCVLKSPDLIEGAVEQISKNLCVKFLKSEYLIDNNLDEVVYESDESSNPDVDITIEVQCRIIQDFV